MKRLPLLLIPCVLSACSPSKPANPVAESVQAISQAVSELSEVVPVKTIPAAFVGRWDASLDACKTTSDMRLDVTPSELRFHESSGAVDEVTLISPTTVTVQASMSGEGEVWQKSLHMVLNDANKTLTIDDGKTGVRVRCP